MAEHAMNTTCVYCHRPLTNPASRLAGAGPVCRAKHNSLPSADDPAEYMRDLHDLPFDNATMDIVCRRDNTGVRHFNIPQRHKHHSPTGMAWGYGGSGPDDFALNILDCFIRRQRWAQTLCHEDREHLWDGSDVDPVVLGLHQEFKWAFIAGLPESGATIKGDDIRAWLRAHDVELAR